MKATITKLLPLAVLLLYAHTSTFAQTSSSVPYWVSVMENDSTANYFQALESFNQYWAGKELPMENDEYMNEERREKKEKHNREMREHRREEREREERMKKQEHTYDSEYKRFVHWKEDMLVFVREDGSIPSLDERIKMINEQR